MDGLRQERPPVVVVRGSGSIGQRHARVLAALGAGVAVWPVRPRRHAEVAVAPASGSLDAPASRLLDDGTGPAALADADLVVVATDTSRHVADAVQALDAGARRVLVEKPVSPTVMAADPLAGHPRADAVWVAAPLRAHQGFRHVAAHASEVGSPVSAHVWSQSWLPDWRPGRDYRESYSARADEGGVLRDLVHEIDYATVLLGEPALLGARLDHDGPLDMAAEQAASLLWTTPSGATVTMRLDYISRPTTRGLLLRGPEGSLEWDVVTARVRHRAADGEVTERVFPADLDRDTVMATQARAALDLLPVAAGAARLEAGAPATLAEGLAALRLCDAARRLSDPAYGPAAPHGTRGGKATST
ncbi:Gfo/Idh/MocA family protein [Monashia sp. NPDC004114]